MKKSLLLFILLNCLCRISSGQKTTVLDSLILPELIDTLFIDRDVNNWSLRLFTNFKNHRFTLSENNHALHYIPNNPFGIGIGLATRKVLLDVGINLETNKNNPSNRLDLQANLILNKHLLDFSLHRYKGFNVFDDRKNTFGFREDILSFGLSLEYLYLFSNVYHSIDVVRSMSSGKNNLETSFAMGGFALIRNQSADSSIIAAQQKGYYSDDVDIVNFKGAGAGIKGSFISIFPLPYNFFTSISFSPGFGLMYKSVENENSVFYPSNLLLLKIDLGGALSYIGNKFYITFRLAVTYNNTDFDYINRGAFSTVHAKLAFGYKLGRNR